MSTTTGTTGTKAGTPTKGREVQRAPLSPTAVGKASEGVGPIPLPKEGYLCGVSITGANAEQTAAFVTRVDDSEILLACSLYVRADVLHEPGATDRSLAAELGKSSGTVGNYRRLGAVLARLGFVTDTPEGFTPEMRQTARNVRKVMQAHTSTAKLLAANGGRPIPTEPDKAIAAFTKIAKAVTTDRARVTKAIRSGNAPEPVKRTPPTPEHVAERAESAVADLARVYADADKSPEQAFTGDTLRHLFGIIRHLATERDGVAFSDYVSANVAETEQETEQAS